MNINMDILGGGDSCIIASFEEMAENAAQVQEALLQAILETNASCEYLYHTCGLRGRTDIPSFKQCVPVITHSNILPCILRIMDGDRSPILTSSPISAMSRSSGTSSGETKFVPFVDSMVGVCAYAKKLSNAYQNRYAGRVPLVGGNYAASEGPVATNIDLESIPPHVSYTLVPNFAYYEFIPYCARSKCNQNMVSKVSGYIPSKDYIVDDDELIGQPRDLSQVKVGEEYEIVLTTRGGLYRYRLQDVVKVTGFFKSCPKFEFVSRVNVILSVAIDMNTEKDLLRAVNDATKWLRETSDNAMELIDYTSYVDRVADPGHYVIFWELSKCMTQESTIQRDATLKQCATLMDRAFMQDPAYLVCRKVGAIGALELCVVGKGTFSKILDFSVRANEGTINQYKVPRLVGSPLVLAILQNSISSTHYSSLTRGDMSIDQKVQ